MYSLFSVVLVALVGVALAGVHFKDCGSTKGVVSTVDISGCAGEKVCPLKRNSNITFEVDFTSKVAATKLTSVVHGIIASVPIPFPLGNPNACKNCGITCPVKEGDSLKYKDNIFVKSAYPKVKLIVKWEVKDGSGNDVFCIEVPAEIED